MAFKDTAEKVRFIKEVEKYPCVYDHKHADHTRRTKVIKAWTEIANKFNMPVTECVLTWGNLRKMFVNSLNKGKTIYYLFKPMKFLLPYTKPLKEVSVKIEKHDDNNGSENDKVHEPIDYEQHVSVGVGKVNDRASLNGMVQEANTGPSTMNGEQNEPARDVTHNEEFPFVLLNSTSLPSASEHEVASTSVGEIVIDLRNSIETRNNSNAITAEEKLSRKRFLLSLASDVYSMSNAQMRSFRMKALQLIEETIQSPNVNPLSVCTEEGPASKKYKRNAPL